MFLDPVEAVKDPEDVNAALGRLLDEEGDDIVGVIGVADPVGAAQQQSGSAGSARPRGSC